MSEPDKKQQDLIAWACIACVRYLRFGHPLKAEHEFVQDVYRDHLWNEMTASRANPRGRDAQRP